MITLLAISILSLSSPTEAIDTIEVSKVSYEYIIMNVKNFRKDKLHVITEYTLKNNSEETYYSWVDYYKPLLERYHPSKTRLFQHYLSRAHGEVNLWLLFTDNVNYSTPESRRPTVGYTCFIEIPPGESFTYIIIRNDKEDPGFDKCIEYAPEEWVGRFIPPREIPSFFIYKRPYIIIEQEQEQEYEADSSQ